MEDKALKKLIDGVEYVSFDIFDTLILRKVTLPEHVFLLISRKYNKTDNKLNFDFVKARIDAESQARILLNQDIEEVTLDDIYFQLKKENNLEDSIVNKLKEYEINLEKKMCCRNEYLFEVYKYCKANDKKVLLTSDMYLPQAVIEKILEINGYNDYEQIFLSSTKGLTKATGRLYENLLANIKAKPEQVLHIGDNLNSDIQMAKKLGIKTFYYEKCLKRASSCKIFKEEGFLSLLNKESNIENSLFLAQILNKYYSNPYKKLKNQEFWYDFGYKTLGLLLFGFSSWIFSKVKEDNPDKIFFLSRDGYILHKLFEQLKPFNGCKVDAKYLYASRRVLTIPSIDVNNNDYDEFSRIQKFLLSSTNTKVSEFIETLGLNPENYHKEIEKSGFNSLNSSIKSESDYLKLCNLYLSVFKDIKDISITERNNLLKYYQKEGLLDKQRISIVDIGWNGTIQNFLDRILKSSSYSIDIFGYYLGTFSTALEFSNKGMSFSSYLLNFSKPESLNSTIKSNAPLLEFLFFAPHGSVIKFDGENPIFDNDCNKEKIAKTTQMHNGAIDFIKDFYFINDYSDLFSLNPEFTFSPIKRFLENPTINEAVEFGNINLIDGHVDAQKFIAKPPSIFVSLLNYNQYKQAYKESYWKEGFKKRSIASLLECYFSKIPEIKLFKKDLRKKKIANFIKENFSQKICFYGAGQFAQDIIEKYDFSNLDVIGFIDKNPDKAGKKIGKYTIFIPDDLEELKPDIIISALLESRYAIPFLENFKKEKNLDFKIVSDLFSEN